MTFESNLAHCRRCSFRAVTASSELCAFDGQPATAHAADAVCPAGRFGHRTRPDPPRPEPAGVVFLPHLGEFGHLILSHVRYVHAHASPVKVVACEPGSECLFPSATSFHTTRNPIPDADRVTHGAKLDHAAHQAARVKLRVELANAMPGHLVVDPAYPDPWEAARIKPRLSVPHVLPAVDVCIGPRRRAWQPERNYAHWATTVAWLRAAGLTIGVVGAPGTSQRIDADVVAWDHPDGATAGSIDLLQHCRHYVGQDSGVSHLAAMLDVPMTVLGNRSEWAGDADDFTSLMQHASDAYFLRAGDDAWDRPGRLAELALRGLR